VVSLLQPLVSLWFLIVMSIPTGANPPAVLSHGGPILGFVVFPVAVVGLLLGFVLALIAFSRRSRRRLAVAVFAIDGATVAGYLVVLIVAAVAFGSTG
jgi:hypothetical protein